jgi:peptide/nickel transport system ATP-binding protein
LSLRQKFGLAIILITHRPSLLAGVADRVLVLYAGRIVEIGPTASVLASPLHPYTGALLRCLPQPLGHTDGAERKTKLPVITGDSPGLISLSHGCRFEPRCPDRFETCRQREPLAISLGNGHIVSCFNFGG